MESTETIRHSLYPLWNEYFIDEVELLHTAGKDFWQGKNGTDQRVWLADTWDESLKLASMARCG